MAVDASVPTTSPTHDPPRRDAFRADGLEGDGEDHDTRTVVEEALRLHQRRERPRDAERPHHRQDCGGVCRGQHGPDQEAQPEVQADGQVEDRGDQQRGDQHPGNGEQDHRGQLRPQDPDVGSVRALEDQGGKQHREEELGVDVHVQPQLRRGDRHAQHHERDAVGDHGDAAHHDRHQARRGKQEDEDLHRPDGSASDHSCSNITTGDHAARAVSTLALRIEARAPPDRVAARPAAKDTRPIAAIIGQWRLRAAWRSPCSRPWALHSCWAPSRTGCVWRP